MLLERPDCNLTVSVDISAGDGDAFVRAFGDMYLSLQPSTTLDDTVLLFEGYLNNKEVVK